MSRWWRAARRIAWMAFTAWLVLSLAFFTFAYTPDPNKALALFGAGMGAETKEEALEEQREALEAFREARNYDEPVLSRYVKWMRAYATLDWGTSLGGKPVEDAVGRSLLVTLTYLVPALLVSTLLAILVGLYVATRHGRLPDIVGTALSYAGYGIPVFFAGEMLSGVLVHRYGMVWLAGDVRHGLYTPENLPRFLLPGILMAVNLLAIQLVFVRAETVEHLHAEFVKTLRASGARTRDVARHAFRNAAIPLVSVFFTEVLTVTYLSVIVLEVVFGLHGFGALTLSAIRARDIGLILGTTFVPLFVGIVGNTLQDVAYSVLDPRVGDDERR